MFRGARLPLLALTVLALVVRLAFLAVDPHPFADSGLAADSAEVARQIDDHGRWFQSNLVALNQLGTLQDVRQQLIDPASMSFAAADAHPHYQSLAEEPPGEAVVLAMVWKLWGSARWLPYMVLMVALAAAMTPLVFYIGMVLFERRRAAYIGAALYAIFPPLAWLSTIPHLDAWAVDLTIAITAMALRARSAPRPTRWLVATGVVAGLGCYFRPELLLLAPLIALAGLTRGRRAEAFRLAALPTLVAIMILVPWTIRNAVVFDRFIPIRIGAGQALWEGLGELPNNFGAVLDDAATYQQVHAVRPNLVYASPAYDSYLLSKGISAVRAHPGFYARIVGHRLAESTLLLDNSEWAGSPTGLSATLVKALEPLLFLISLLVIVLTRRRYGRAHLTLVAVLVATALPYLLLHFEARYVLPGSFAYLLWAGLGADLAAQRLQVRPVPSTLDVRHLRHPGDLG